MTTKKKKKKKTKNDAFGHKIIIKLFGASKSWVKIRVLSLIIWGSVNK